MALKNLASISQVLNNNERFTIAIVLIAYASLIFALLDKTPLWLDELQQFGGDRKTSVRHLLTWVAINRGAAPLPYLIQKVFIDAFGFSTFVARVPAASCSILGGVAFAVLLQRVGVRYRGIALLAFLLSPLQFRYALEARVYSQGLLGSLLSICGLLYLTEKPSVGRTAIACAAISFGLYSQPYSIFPASGVLLWMVATRSAGWPLGLAALFGAVSTFLPWYLHSVQEEILHPDTRAFFSLAQIDPLNIVHEFTGSGYLCTLSALALARFGFFGAKDSPIRKMLACSLLAAVVGPIAVDAAFNYFFAGRQFVFATAPLAALAGLCLPSVDRRRAKTLVIGVWILFVGACLFKDVELATVPKDSLAAGADAVVSLLTPSACVLAAPPSQVDYYVLIHPEIGPPKCPDNPRAEEVVAILSQYSSDADRSALSARLASYRMVKEVRMKRNELRIYRRLAEPAS